MTEFNHSMGAEKDGLKWDSTCSRVGVVRDVKRWLGARGEKTGAGAGEPGDGSTSIVPLSSWIFFSRRRGMYSSQLIFW